MKRVFLGILVGCAGFLPGCVEETGDDTIVDGAVVDETGGGAECVTPASECVAFGEARYCENGLWSLPVDCPSSCVGSHSGCCGILPDGNEGCLCCGTDDCYDRPECGTAP